MKLPEIDNRTREDILGQIRRMVPGYTPEWRFDEENPDVGTALALLYADMMANTIYRFNQVSDKNRIAFYNSLSADLLPAVPAKGFVTFALVNDDVDGVEVVKGTKLLADSEDGDSLTFETVNDLYVTTAQPDCMYLCDKELDRICNLFEYTDTDKEFREQFLFDYDRENLQEHVMYFSHPSILRLSHAAWVYLNFSSRMEQKLSEEQLALLLNRSVIRFEYYSEEGFQEFVAQEAFHGEIALKKGEHQPAFAPLSYQGTESYFIRCVVSQIKPFSDFRMEQLYLRSEGTRLQPETITAGGVDQRIREFLPFGERPALYDEVYIASEEVFGKKGASITLDFILDFVQIPLEVQEAETEINWKKIMRRSEIKPNQEFDISVAEVIWEYYNGEGFVRLFVNDQYSDLFDIRHGVTTRQVSIHFRCPDDIQPYMVNAADSYCIRMRVLKMNNLYKMRGSYISPCISQPQLKYEYTDNHLIPEHMFLQNNMEMTEFRDYGIRKNTKPFYPFCGREESGCLYLGFLQPLTLGPIKMLLVFEHTLDDNMPQLHYEYFGARGWTSLNVIDGTENFRKTGIITILNIPDMKQKHIFGKDRYWIRIQDANQEYLTWKNERMLPKLKGIYMNSTEVLGIETMEPEQFTIRINEENRCCKLQYEGIVDCQVWVNEKKSIHATELRELEAEGRVRYERDSGGEITSIWILWEETERFQSGKRDKRWYLLDRIHGEVLFPNGVNGRIPTSDDIPTIQIYYSRGGGKNGNLGVGSIQRLNNSIGFISEVTNHEITVGGSDQETVSAAVNRIAKRLRHGNRAVTASDYEALCLEASRSIEKVRCFSNYDSTGKKEYGHITLVVLQKDYINGRRFFDGIEKDILNYLQDKISPQLLQKNRIHIVEPQFIEMNVTVSVYVKDYNQIFEIRNQIDRKLKIFLDPLVGSFNHTGWEIGILPNIAQITNSVKDTPGISSIEYVRITAYQQGIWDRVEVDFERTRMHPYVLALSGSHQILVKVVE